MWIFETLQIISIFFCASRLIFTLRARKQIIIRKLRLSPKRNRLNVDVNLITECLDFGDWKLVYHLLRNMNSETFAEFCEHLTEKLRGELVSQTAQCLKITLKSLTIQRAKRVGLPSITFNWEKKKRLEMSKWLIWRRIFWEICSFRSKSVTRQVNC